jgi:predicted ATPase/DNA-binding SARP family transcriptional activator
MYTTRKTIQLNPQVNLWLDTAEFQECLSGCTPASDSSDLESGCIARLEEAVQLYKDDFLAGFSLPDSPAFDEWQFFQSESLRRACKKALEHLAHLASASKEWEQAIAYTRRLVALDVLDEAAHRSLMELYSRSGQQAAALYQYEECRRILDQELGVVPETETTSLYEMIKHRRKTQVEITPADKVLASETHEERTKFPGPPHNLPVHPTPFVGREQELSAVHHLLVAEPNCRLLTINGPGGIGKTRLALESAHAALRAFSDGAYFVPLASLSSSDHIIATLAERIGLGFYDGSTSRQQLLHFLQKKRLLLVMDNLEHLLPGAGVIADILESAPGVKILATSQERLNLVGETIFTLENMSYPQHEVCDDPLAYGAVQLFIQFARLTRPQIALQDSDLCEIVRICRLVHGMPLALILAASWLEMLSFKEIADEITCGLDFLESQMRDLPERQRSVRATFAYSWKRLSQVEKQAFMRLSVFPQGFTRQAAHHVASASLHNLRRLLDKSLLSIRSDGRYEIHELLRKFTEEQLMDAGEMDQIRQAHSAYFLSKLARHESHLKGGRQFETLEEIDADLENVRLAWKWALEHQDVNALEGAVESLYLFFTFRCRYQEGVEFFYQSWQQLTSDPKLAESLLSPRLLARSIWLRSLGHDFHPNMEADIESALDSARAHTDQAEIAYCLLLKGCYYLYTKKDPSNALTFLEQSYAQYRSLQDKFYIAVTLLWLGTCHAEFTHLDNLIYYTQQSLELARESGNKATIPYNLRNLSLGALGTWAYSAAENYSLEALQLNTEMGMRMGIAEAKNHLGLVYFLRGEMDAAHKLVAEGLVVSQEVGFSPTIANGLAIMGLLSAIRGDNQEAKRLAQESLSISASFFGQILANWGLAIVHCNLQQFDTAGNYLQEAWNHAWRLSYRAVSAWLLPAIAMILDWRGNKESATAGLCLAWKHHLNPKGWLDRWEEAHSLRTRLQKELGPTGYESACQQSEIMDLQCMVAEFFEHRHDLERMQPLGFTSCQGCY